MKTAWMPGESGLENAGSAVAGLAWWSRLCAAFQRALDKLAPLGYEDEHGFHLGLEPGTPSEEQPFH